MRLLTDFVARPRGSRGCGPGFISMLLGGLFALAMIVTPATAQYRFDHWTTDNGLPQNTIRSLVQTRDGYLWFTTFDGLVRFDGVRFTVFDRNNTPGIINNRFTQIVEDRDGTLYALMESSALTVYRNGVFTSYPQADELPGPWIEFLIPDRNGEIIIYTRGVAYYLRNGAFIAAPPEYQRGWLHGLHLASARRFWTVDQQGVHLLEDGRMLDYPLSFDTLHIEVWLYEDRLGRLWIGGTVGLYCWQDGIITRYTEKDGLPPHTEIRPYCEDNDGGIWFITGQVRVNTNGLARLKDGRFTFFDTESGMPPTDIGQVITDREGTVWIATAAGLYRARKQIVTAYSTGQGLSGKEVYPLLETRNGDILIGTTLGMSRFRQGRISSLPPLEELKFSQALWEDPRGRLWVGHIGGMDIYENGKAKDLYPRVLGTVCAIQPDGQGYVWVATDSTGLFKFEGEQIIAHYTAADHLPSNDVKVIHQSPDGTLWFGTYGGLVRFKDGQFTTWTAKDGLASDRVRSIYEDADGVLWVGTYDGGLSRFRDGQFFNYTIDNGLCNNGVFCILEDRHGNFWMSSNRGIYRAGRRELNDFADGKLAQLNCIAYGKSDGMLNTECNGGRQPAGIIARDGKLWFGTQDGVAVVDPDAIAENPVPPPVEIETIAIDRHAVAFSDGVQIKPSQTSLDITYTALSLIKSDLIRFKYRLEGLDKDWIDAGERRTAYYSYLPPGEYTFKVIAANSDGIWNPEGKAIKVIVIPPVYRRWWFVALVITATFGLIFFIYRYRVSQLERERAAQHEFSRQLIASQEDERKRIAAELHDSLGQTLLIIKNRAYMGARSANNGKPAPEAAREQFDEISDSAAEAIDQVREIAYYLRPSQLERLGLTAAIEEMLDQVAEASGIQFEFAIDRLDGLFSPEAEINFYRIAQECANNIVKHSGATAAEVRITRDVHGVEFMMIDNGRGFDPHAAQANRAGKSGFGLTGIAERVRILGGKHTIESAPGSGTTVKVRIEMKEQRRGTADDER